MKILPLRYFVCTLRPLWFNKLIFTTKDSKGFTKALKGFLVNPVQGLSFLKLKKEAKLLFLFLQWNVS